MMGKLKSRLSEPSRQRARTPLCGEGFVIRSSHSGTKPGEEELRGALEENRGHLLTPELLMLGIQALFED